MPSIAVLTISDSTVAGTREDVSGPLAVDLLRAALTPDRLLHEVVDDDPGRISAALIRFADHEAIDLVVTSGGTGISPRDHTPQATRAVLDYEVPGLAELMRAVSLQKTPMASLSRAVAGVRGCTLVVNLPGSPKGVRECLESILPVLPHALEQLRSGAGH
ncbi:MAG TPA: MogA/MoaB family molybdenum cofactor biosynthesis protein [Chloroflexia bacterium]|nr:MogA/MoaB family molybdenum cofactor biosynthesis protein [Chloroflexia bacterium]